MPVIGHAANNGHSSFIYKFGQDNFLCTVADTVHAAHPFYLVSRFECFGSALLLCHSGNDDFHALVTGLVDLEQILEQSSLQHIVVVEDFTVLYTVTLALQFIIADQTLVQRGDFFVSHGCIS